MKIAVLADIHANWVAFQTALAHVDAWGPDQVVVAGDIVNRGPRSPECLREVLERQRMRGWLVTRGNHEDYVIGHAAPGAPVSGPELEIRRVSYWTYLQLDRDVSALQAMPFSLELPAPDGAPAEAFIRVTHASMRGLRDGVYVNTPEEVMRQQRGSPQPGVFVHGHTHQPFVKELDGGLVINVGAVGLPFDRDPRLSYAQLEWRAGVWHARIIRLPFDRAAAERDFASSGFLDTGGGLVPLLLSELRTCQGQLFTWSQQYEAAVLAGEITVEEAVRRFLAS